MNHFYTAPSALLQTNRPEAAYHATVGPDDATVALIVVSGWPDHASQDAFEALPGVVEHAVWDWRGPAHVHLHGAFASHGVRPSHSTGEAMRLIRRHWPVARP